MYPNHAPSRSPSPSPLALREKEKNEVNAGEELAEFGLANVSVSEDDIRALVEELGLGGDEADDLVKGLSGSTQAPLAKETKSISKPKEVKPASNSLEVKPASKPKETEAALESKETVPAKEEEPPKVVVKGSDEKAEQSPAVVVKNSDEKEEQPQAVVVREDDKKEVEDKESDAPSTASEETAKQE